VDLLGRGVPSVPKQERNIAEVARTLIDHRYMTAMSVDEIARQLRVDRSTLFRKFREAYDMSPKAYLDSVRLERARKLLTQSRATVRETAMLCGFEDSHYFSRVYKNAFGHPPSEERQS
jgi:transcriptional regulator GlxA family with amidase domain